MPYIDAHRKYLKQTNWSRAFREYLYQKLPGQKPLRILEVGCGTGAILDCIRNEYSHRIGSLTGVDLDIQAMRFSRMQDPVRLIAGNAEKLPFKDGSFDFVICHFLLLWVNDPKQALKEMKRVTAAGGICAAFAEPCYEEMTAEPASVYQLACRQRLALAERGADIGIGSRLGELFTTAGFKKTEWGRYQKYEMRPEEIYEEIALMQEDAGFILPAKPEGSVKFEVPTYFAFAVKEFEENDSI